MVKHYFTLRTHALGNFRKLALAMLNDGAMQLWLDLAGSDKNSPNENFARELMELFTLGNGAFTEADVVGMARAWTGYNYDRPGEQFIYRPNKHDSGPKTIFGITKDWSGPEAITEIVRGSRQATCARYLAGKVWSFFAHPAPAAALVDDLAAALKDAPEAWAHYQRLAPTHQREYVNWIEEAKRPATRQERVAKTLHMLKEGRKRDGSAIRGGPAA